MGSRKLFLIIISSIFYIGSALSANNYKNPNGILELPTETQEAEVRKLDTELAQRIHERLSDEWASNGGYRYLGVKVNNGVVSLTGLVETLNDKKKVEDRIKNMVGVRRLDSEIKILKNKENSMDESYIQDNEIMNNEYINQKH
jgi:osmotically-inducible protein OsmY